MVARRHDVNTNLLFTWRRRYGTEVQGSGESATFVPAMIANDAIVQTAAPAVAGSIAGRMEIELPGGCRLIAGNDVDTAVLGRVIRALLHR
jgi:transposase